MYESLLTARLEKLLAERPDDTRLIYDVDSGDEPHVLARHVRHAVERALRDEKDPVHRRALVNRILAQLGNETDLLGSGSRQLHFLHRPAGPGVEYVAPDRPSTPLSDAALLTNSIGEPSLGSELRAELETADSVDLLIAFVKWYGLRLLEPQLRRLRDRGIPLRVITTTYMGATERQALDRLVSEFGAQVKIQYDSLRTRLHAKAWLFNRRTGFNTAYVGSSNLSRAALLDGVEWNVRLSAVATPALMHKFEATFETYWNDTSFEDYDPERDRDRLDDALALASGGGTKPDQVTISISGLDVQPFPYQAEMLESLDVERIVHDRHRNLVVAATGTGKTVLAALDYRRLYQRDGRWPRLLFVAHRQEILTQSLRTYREVLRNQDFGELYVGGTRPERWEHVFASVQSLNSYGVTNIPAGHFEVVVIDEFHHAQARTYRNILEHLQPSELLGLTATPERADGTDVAQTFFDGRIAAELRLWDALASELLSPFHYFGISDGTDLSAITWKRGAYDTDELEKVYTGNDARAALILRAIRDKITSPRRMKALGFCVSVAHAEYMSRVFTNAGIAAVAVTSHPGSADRAQALSDLRAGRVAVVFTVDMFNEGVDVPSVDTVLFLRPTESATIFLQQLGRGLRRADDKAVLTALDFVGHQNKSFRFADRFRALTGTTRKGLADQVDKGFPFLPSGCQIILDEQTQDVVLDNLKGQLATRWKVLATELRNHPTDSLATYLHETGVDLADIIRADRSWTRLRRDAHLPTAPEGPQEPLLLKRARAFSHVDDPERAQAYLTWLSEEAPTYGAASPRMQEFGRMLFFSLWTGGGGFTTYDAGLRALRDEPNVREDLRQVIQLGLDHATHVTRPLTGGLGTLPLQVHARYTREEAVAALRYASLGGRAPNSFREGVLHSQEIDSDAFFVTFKKSEADYSPTTMYRDYAISPELFHWESQSSTSVRSATGQRYINHEVQGSHILLFARDSKVNDFGGGAPYVFLGPASYVSHKGERPIAFTWRLHHPLPQSIYISAAAAS
ncbi:DUF3427 domain-containing protein [Janibacter alittae]|uniref:DUF3427 domain-containing protein n=1 Tax=Janibacter alittae TaxID=3115209 RepID=A0ABZ2MLR4_9MICO